MSDSWGFPSELWDLYLPKVFCAFKMDEQKLIDIEVKATEAWFKSPRFRLTKRPYTAQDGYILLMTLSGF